MCDKVNQMKSMVELCREFDIKSLQCLELLVALNDTEQKTAELCTSAGINRDALYKMQGRHSTLLGKKVIKQSPENRQRGKEPIIYFLTERGRLFMNKWASLLA